MTMHTPGPWKLGQYLGSPRQFVIHMDVGDKGRGLDVAFTSAAFGNNETIANARLIAAAPDLLEALKRCKFDSLNMTLEDREFCRAAIAKATGEQS